MPGIEIVFTANHAFLPTYLGIRYIRSQTRLEHGSYGNTSAVRSGRAGMIRHKQRGGAFWFKEEFIRKYDNCGIRNLGGRIWRQWPGILPTKEAYQVKLCLFVL